MKRLLASLTVTALLVPAIAAAEEAEVRLTQQYGPSYLPLVVARTQHLIEKHAKAAGIDDQKTTCVQLGGGAAVNRSTIHKATGGYALPQRRLMHRTTLKGEELVEA